MWSAGSEVLDVYVGLTHGGVARGSQRVVWQPHATLETGLAALFDCVSGQRSGRWRRRAAARVWLSGALARPFLCGPIEGLKRWAEVEAFAQAMAPDATGLAAPCLVHVDEWPSPNAALAVAMDGATRETIEAAARERGVALKSLRPWWTAALNQVLASSPQTGLVAAADGDALTLLGGEGLRYQYASGYVPRPSEEQASKLIARFAMTAGVPLERVVRARFPDDETPGSEGVPFGVVVGAAA